MEGVKRYATLLSLSFAIQIKFVTPPRARDNDGKAWLTMPLPHCRLSQRCHLFSIVDFVRVFFFVLLLLLCSAAHGKSCERVIEREKKLAGWQCKYKQLSAKLSTRAAQFRFQSQMQTNRCLCFCTCNDNKAQLSGRARVRAHKQLWSSLTRALSFSTVPVSPHPLSKRAHLLRTFQAVSKVSPTELLRQRR